MPTTTFFARFAVMLAIASVLLPGCGHESEQSQQPESAPEVGVVELQTQAVELFTELPGRTTANRVAEVRPQVGGIIEQRLFKEGSQVRSGDQLYQIDARSYRAEYNRAKAGLAKARAAVNAARVRERRFRELLDDNAVSEQAYDDTNATLQQALGDLGVAEAALETAQINLEYTRVKAPIDGQIGASRITEGALVTADQAAPLAQVTQLDPIFVDISRSTAELLRLKKEFERDTLEKAGPGQAEVTLLLEDGSEYAHTGTLQFSGVTVDPATGAVTLRALFPNPERDLLPGMYVRARLSEGVKQQAILVPQQGVTHNSEGRATVLLVTDDGTVKKQQVETRQAIGAFWLVSKGLSVGDKVIVTGLHHAEPDAKVTPVEAEIPNKPAPGVLESGASGPALDPAMDGARGDNPAPQEKSDQQPEPAVDG